MDDFSQEVLESFLREHKKEPFDFVFAYVIDGMINGEIFSEIDRIGVPTCNFSCNNVHQFQLVEKLSRHFTLSLHAERDVASLFRGVGARPLWWPMASNPRYFRPIPTPAFEFDITFVGANYGPRFRYLEKLLQAGLDAHAFGPGWRWGARTPVRSLGKGIKLLAATSMALNGEVKSQSREELLDHLARWNLTRLHSRNLHNPLSDDALIRLYSASQLSLGILDVYDGHSPLNSVVRHVHLREFEAPMSGALYLTGDCDELHEYFVPGVEVATYEDAADLVFQAERLLGDRALAKRIRKAGRRRALSDHTYHRRFRDLIAELGL